MRSRRSFKPGDSSFVHSIEFRDVEPEQRLVAAIITLSVHDALYESGDRKYDAWEFLLSPGCRYWLRFLIPDSIDAVAAQAKLIGMGEVQACLFESHLPPDIETQTAETLLNVS